MSALLRVADLKIHFPVRGPGRFGGRFGGLFARPVPLRAVDGVSFDLQAGETLGVVGESGCGKSTLGRAILRLIPSTSGQILWLGQDITGLKGEALRAKRRQMQIVFQDPLASLDPRMTIGDIVGEPLSVFHPELTRAERRERVQGMLAKVGLLPQMINRYPHEFSGGQCQRIGIARAMVLQPALVVCDEPVSALDVSIQAQIVNLLMRLQDEFKLSLMFISHDLAVVRHVSHRVMVLYLGKIMEIADRDDIYARALHPYTQALIAAVPIPDPVMERTKPRIVLGGDLPSPIDPPSGCVFRTRCPRATEICAKVTPPLEAKTGAGHLVACHHWGPAP